MLEKSNTWPEQVLDTLNSCWRALLESLSNTQANVRRQPLRVARLRTYLSVSVWRAALVATFEVLCVEHATCRPRSIDISSGSV